MNEKFVGFDALKRSVSMLQILDRYGLTERLRRSGDSLSGACPLHQGHNASQFRVSVTRNCWICFGDCHAGGSIVDFVSRKESVGIRDAAPRRKPNGSSRWRESVRCCCSSTRTGPVVKAPPKHASG